MNPLISSFCGSQISSTGSPLKSLVFRNSNSVPSQRRNGVIGIATRYGLDGPRIESRWGGGEIFRTCPDRPWGPPSLLYNGYRRFPGVTWPGRGVDHPHPSSADIKERVELHFSSSPWDFVACSRVICTVTFSIAGIS